MTDADSVRDRLKSSPMGQGLAVGFAIGVALSVAIGNWGMLAVGIAIGVGIGTALDRDKEDTGDDSG